MMEARLSAFGQSWGWIVTYGVLSILVGLIALIWPSATLVAIAIIFAVQLIVTAVFRFVLVFALPSQVGWLRALTALVAILSLVIGIYLLGHLGLTLLVLAVLLGIYWIAHGGFELFLAIGHSELRGRGWTAFSGVLSIIAGAVLVIYPGISLFALTLVLGVFLILFGATLVGRGIQLRSVAHRVSVA
jgi:uncharacterized membrane protein HdeD (DUF308 family)